MIGFVRDGKWNVAPRTLSGDQFHQVEAHLRSEDYETDIYRIYVSKRPKDVSVQLMLFDNENT